MMEGEYETVPKFSFRMAPIDFKVTVLFNVK